MEEYTLMTLADLANIKFIPRYHASKTGFIPNHICIKDCDHNHWEDFIEYVNNNYIVKEENKITKTVFSADGSVRKLMVVHCDSNITLCMHHSSDASLVYDVSSSEEALNDLIPRFKSLMPLKTQQSIGVIRNHGSRLDVKSFEYSLPETSIIEYLDDSIQQLRSNMVEQFKDNSNGGLYLLYGEPGTGKTSFIKEVVSTTEKDALFISPSFTTDLTSPNLISLLMEHPDSILVIEDAETVLMERQADNSSAVSNLLNLTDGFLADFLNLTVICTFNTELESIDDALLRQGRLKQMQEFTKIKPKRARKIADALGSDFNPDEPATLAEIADGASNSNYMPKQIGYEDSLAS